MRQCALMPECEKSGYGVYTSDNKFVKFDAEGNRKAVAAIKASTKLDDLEVEVTGEIVRHTIKGATIALVVENHRGAVRPVTTKLINLFISGVCRLANGMLSYGA